MSAAPQSGEAEISAGSRSPVGNGHGLSPRVERFWLAGVLITYVLLSFVYNAITPIGEACDEIHHVRYVQHLLRFGTFAPVGPGETGEPYTLEAKQPPAYYLINTGVMLGFGRCGKDLAPELQHNPRGPEMGPGYTEPLWFLHPPVPLDLLPWTHIMRFVSMLMGLGSILLTFATVREVLPAPAHGPLALGAAATTGLLPSFTFVSSTVNNDNLAILSGCATAYWLARIVRRGSSIRGAVALGLLTGLALLSKMNTLGLVPVVFLVLLVNRVAHKEAPGRTEPARTQWAAALARELRVRVPLIALAAILVLLVAGWWYLRNILVYGDVFAFRAVNEMAAEVLPGRSTPRSGPPTWLRQIFMVTGTHYGEFGCVAVKAPLVLWLTYMAMILLAFVGLVASLVRRMLSRIQVAQVAVALLAVLLVYGTMIYNAVGLGRLLYPVIAFTSLLLVLGTFGLLSLVSRRNPPVVHATAAALLWTAFLGATNIYNLFFVLVPAWYP